MTVVAATIRRSPSRYDVRASVGAQPYFGVSQLL
jgi:hypothetical protein